MIDNHVPDIRFLLDAVLSGGAGVLPLPDSARIRVAGHSFGG